MATFHTLQLAARGINLILCYSIERRLLEACTWFPLDFTTPRTFPFVDLVWSLFGVINYSLEYSMLDAVSPPSEPSKLGVVMGSLKCSKVLYLPLRGS